MKRVIFVSLVVASFAFGADNNMRCEEFLIYGKCINSQPAYDMPGGKGSLDKIIGRDPKTGKVEPYYRDVTKEEADKIRAKNRYDDANKELEKAKIAYNKKPTNENKSKVEEASHKAELAKAHLQEANEKKGQ